MPMQWRTRKDGMTRSQLRIGSLASNGQPLARLGRRFKNLILNKQADEAWAKFALAEAMEELRAVEKRKQLGHIEERRSD